MKLTDAQQKERWPEIWASNGGRPLPGLDVNLTNEQAEEVDKIENMIKTDPEFLPFLGNLFGHYRGHGQK